MRGKTSKDTIRGEDINNNLGATPSDDKMRELYDGLAMYAGDVYRRLENALVRRSDDSQQSLKENEEEMIRNDLTIYNLT